MADAIGALFMCWGCLFCSCEEEKEDEKAKEVAVKSPLSNTANEQAVGQGKGAYSSLPEPWEEDPHQRV